MTKEHAGGRAIVAIQPITSACRFGFLLVVSRETLYVPNRGCQPNAHWISDTTLLGQKFKSACEHLSTIGSFNVHVGITVKSYLELRLKR